MLPRLNAAALPDDQMQAADIDIAVAGTKAVLNTRRASSQFVRHRGSIQLNPTERQSN